MRSRNKTNATRFPNAIISPCEKQSKFNATILYVCVLKTICIIFFKFYFEPSLVETPITIAFTAVREMKKNNEEEEEEGVCH